MKNKIKIYTLGCKVNQYDSGDLGRRLADRGFEIARKEADYAIINTCAVTKPAIKKNKEAVKKARRENPLARIIIAGCWPVNYREEAEKFGDGLIFGTNEADRITEMLAAMEAEKLSGAHGGVGIVESFDKSRYTIKVQDGCEQFCSYCIIPYNRGKLSSRDEEGVVNEAQQAIAAGFSEIVLCGIHLGLFGINNLDGKKVSKGNLPALLKRLTSFDGLGRVRLSSIEPNEVTDELIALMEADRKICRHLHIPLQAGTDKILKAMNRPYTLDFYKKKIAAIRKAMPDIAITTDVIVGFPGESEEDFKAGLENIKKLSFSRLHVFSFSPHEKTPAAKLPGRVDAKEIARRSRELRDLNLVLQKEFKLKQKGKPQQVVIEKIIGDKIHGKSEYYVDMVFDRRRVKNNNGELKSGMMVDFV